MQLVAYGAQDIYLTGNPQITFFKVVYRRHTNFACEAIEQVFTGNLNFGKKSTCTISRNGDLLSNMYLEMDISLNGVATPRLGHALIDYVELEIGGQSIDKHYGEWMDIWTQLTHTTEKIEKLERLIDGSLNHGTNNRKLYVPLQFWFNRNPGLALPLIALQYHEIKLNVVLKKASVLKAEEGEVPELKAICLYCDYIFLDTDERRRFAQGSHEYLIEQVQFNGRHSLSQGEKTANIELRFNHPCKELVWVCQNNGNENTFNYLGNGDDNKDQISSAVLQLNGHDRFRQREGTYFRVVQPYQHHTGGHKQSETQGHSYVYSFAIKPEEHQPSGTCNFSRIDNAVLTLDINDDNKGKQVRVYATNYNVLRIMSGMGGLAYSN